MLQACRLQDADNKVNKGGAVTSVLAQVVAPIMSNYRQIETCLECSSQKLIFTGEVFSYAVKAVVNPVSPLFDPQAQDGEGRLKDLCVRALRRVFLMCDQDQVGRQYATALGCSTTSCILFA